ncbi:MAG: presenilin family intramembrane aspartyl protease [Patescibacteria group bacterium]|nr:presenilin family intramembrane aspartyl protease [Patescibacteria group bacterium]
MPADNETKEQAEIKSIQNPWRIFAIEAFLFCLTLGLGITTAFRINEIFKIEKITLPQIPFWKFIFYFLLATLFIFLISRFLKFKKGKGILFKIIFVLAVFWGGILLLSVWIPDLFALILMTILVFWWWKKPSVLNQNILIILGIAGVGSVLGLSLEPLMVVILLIIFSIYDFIAVYKTKHMIKMAKEMIEAGAILALVVPPNISGLRESLEEVKPGGKFLILGGGDVVFPLLFSASLIPFGILKSAIVASFALIGLFVGFYFFAKQKVRQPIPALPPIAFFSIIGFLITKLI